MEFETVVLCAYDETAEMTYFNRVSIPAGLTVVPEAAIAVAHNLIGETWFESEDMWLADPAKVAAVLTPALWTPFVSHRVHSVFFEFASMPGHHRDLLAL